MGGGAAVVAAAALPTTGDTVHTLCTSNGSPYLNFQLRIMCAMLLRPGATLAVVRSQAGGKCLRKQHLLAQDPGIRQSANARSMSTAGCQPDPCGPASRVAAKQPRAHGLRPQA